MREACGCCQRHFLGWLRFYVDTAPGLHVAWGFLCAPEHVCKPVSRLAGHFPGSGMGLKGAGRQPS
ncbi:MAG: hypothetical protein HFG63_10160 [Lachnospiraceae bacterium]|nr:hypothetical protein [Lachnospiraceae bacterium]